MPKLANDSCYLRHESSIARPAECKITISLSGKDTAKVGRSRSTKTVSDNLTKGFFETLEVFHLARAGCSHVLTLFQAIPSASSSLSQWCKLPPGAQEMYRCTQSRKNLSHWPIQVSICCCIGAGASQETALKEKNTPAWTSGGKVQSKDPRKVFQGFVNVSNKSTIQCGRAPASCSLDSDLCLRLITKNHCTDTWNDLRTAPALTRGTAHTAPPPGNSTSTYSTCTNTSNSARTHSTCTDMEHRVSKVSMGSSLYTWSKKPL